MPESAAFRALYPPSAIQELEELIKELRSEFEVSIHDCRTWLDDAALYDGHHLLPKGAEQLSIRLAPMVRRLTPCSR
jgi:hypothetical protein